METEDSQRLIGDITVELQEISGSVDKAVNAFSDKQFYDRELATSISTVIENSIKSLIETKNFDEGLGETIKTAIGEAAGKIATMKIDVEPVMKIGLQMVNQVKEMISAFVNMPRPESNDSKYDGIITVMMGVIQKNNELMQMIVEKYNAPVVQMESREVDYVEMLHFRENDRLKTTKIITKYKTP